MDKFKGKNAIPQEEFSFAQSVIAKLGDYFSNRVVGQEELKKSLITAVVADGHILIESVPGLAKTTAAKAISDAVSGKFFEDPVHAGPAAQRHHRHADLPSGDREV